MERAFRFLKRTSVNRGATDPVGEGLEVAGSPGELSGVELAEGEVVGIAGRAPSRAGDGVWARARAAHPKLAKNMAIDLMASAFSPKSGRCRSPRGKLESGRVDRQTESK